MGKKKNRSSTNIFLVVGRPVFSLLIRLVSAVIFAVLFIEKLFSLFSTLSFPKVVLPQLKIPVIKLPRLSLPRFKLQLPKPKVPHFDVKLNFRQIIFVASFFGLATFVYFEIFYNLPNPEILAQYPSKLTTQILDRNGVLLYKIYKDENRTLVTLSSLPSYVKNSFLAAEDKDFYSHNGYSLTGLLRAVYKNIFDEKLEGGSTITQQLIKNTILTSEKTFTRKAKEIILAIRTEQIFTKDKIFEMYLNQVGFGGPAYGIQEAARQYFDVDAKDLSLSQAAFLAGLTRAPSKYSPYGEQPELALTRQNLVLHQMYDDGFITQGELEASLTEKLDFKSAKIEIKAPHFVMLVKSILVDQLGENTVTQGGLKVYTTLDSTLQDSVQKIVTDEVAKIKNLKVSNGSALVTNPKTGEILAMVGSKDYFNLKENGQVNLTTAVRQPGSSIKPLNYAMYLESGHSPSSIITDQPVTVRLSSTDSWTPKNYDGKFHGSVTLRQALASSYNIPSVLILLQNGVTNFADFAQKLGITTWNEPKRYGPSLALGSLEVKMTDLATAYSTFANGGTTSALNTIIKVEKSNNESIKLASCPDNTNSSTSETGVNALTKFCTTKRNLSPTTAYLISDILSDNSARSPAFGANSVLNIRTAKVAVKTGTSNDLKDNWAIGYTPNFLVATWVGNNDNTPMSQIASGVTGASPIWAKIFNHILETNQEPKTINPPENLVKVPVCILTGTLTCAGCPTRIDYFAKGTEPKTACDPADIQRRLNATPTPSSGVVSPKII